MPPPTQLPESIRDFVYKHSVQIDSGRDFDHHMDSLIRQTDKILGKAQPNALAAGTPRSSLFFPLVGGVMTVIGLMHIGWFLSNLLTALSTGTVQQMFQEVWTFADMSFGLGGLIIGIGTIFGAHWARSTGIVLCFLAVFSNLLWFTDHFNRGLSHSVLFGTALTSILAVIGAYLLLFRWPVPTQKQ